MRRGFKPFSNFFRWNERAGRKTKRTFVRLSGQRQSLLWHAMFPEKQETMCILLRASERKIREVAVLDQLPDAMCPTCLYVIRRAYVI